MYKLFIRLAADCPFTARPNGVYLQQSDQSIMATDWCRKWNFEDDLLGWCTGGHSYFTKDEESLCNILKVCDNDCTGNLILILGLEMESILST